MSSIENGYTRKIEDMIFRSFHQGKGQRQIRAKTMTRIIGSSNIRLQETLV